MSGGGGFIGQIIKYLLQDVVVHSLANSKRFQRLALRIDNFFATSQKSIETKAEEIAKGAEKLAAEVQQTQTQKAVKAKSKSPKPGDTFDPILFMSHVVDEVKRDINGAPPPGKKK